MKYFKCHFCKVFKRKRFNVCATHSLKHGEYCKYNTWFSIYKWFVRILWTTISCTIILGYILFIINLVINVFSLSAKESSWFFSLLALLIFGVAPLVWGIITFFKHIHKSFEQQGGSIFEKYNNWRYQSLFEEEGVK